MLPDRGEPVLLRVAPVLRRPAGLSSGPRLSGLWSGDHRRAETRCRRRRSSRPPGTGVVRWFAGRWPSTVDRPRSSVAESPSSAVESGVLELKENPRGRPALCRVASWRRPPAAAGSSVVDAGRSRTLVPSPLTAGVGLAGGGAAVFLFASDPPRRSAPVIAPGPA